MEPSEPQPDVLSTLLTIRQYLGWILAILAIVAVMSVALLTWIGISLSSEIVVPV